MTTTISGSNGIVFPDATSMQTGQQAVKAWVNFTGNGTVAIRAGYNVSSITDNGVGLYTVNFTTAISDADYCATVGASQPDSTSVNFAVGFNDASGSYTTTALSFRAANSAGPQFDPSYLCVAIFR